MCCPYFDLDFAIRSGYDHFTCKLKSSIYVTLWGATVKFSEMSGEEMKMLGKTQSVFGYTLRVINVTSQSNKLSE